MHSSELAVVQYTAWIAKSLARNGKRSRDAAGSETTQRGGQLPMYRA